MRLLMTFYFIFLLDLCFCPSSSHNGMKTFFFCFRIRWHIPCSDTCEILAFCVGIFIIIQTKKKYRRYRGSKTQKQSIKKNKNHGELLPTFWKIFLKEVCFMCAHEMELFLFRNNFEKKNMKKFHLLISIYFLFSLLGLPWNEDVTPTRGTILMMLVPLQWSCVAR